MYYSVSIIMKINSKIYVAFRIRHGFISWKGTRSALWCTCNVMWGKLSYSCSGGQWAYHSIMGSGHKTYTYPAFTACTGTSQVSKWHVEHNCPQDYWPKSMDGVRLIHWFWSGFYVLNTIYVIISVVWLLWIITWNLKKIRWTARYRHDDANLEIGVSSSCLLIDVKGTIHNWLCQFDYQYEYSAINYSLYGASLFSPIMECMGSCQEILWKKTHFRCLSIIKNILWIFPIFSIKVSVVFVDSSFVVNSLPYSNRGMRHSSLNFMNLFYYLITIG